VVTSASRFKLTRGVTGWWLTDEVRRDITLNYHVYFPSSSCAPSTCFPLHSVCYFILSCQFVKYYHFFFTSYFSPDTSVSCSLCAVGPGFGYRLWHCGLKYCWRYVCMYVRVCVYVCAYVCMYVCLLQSLSSCLLICNYVTPILTRSDLEEHWKWSPLRSRFTEKYNIKIGLR
jgi:nuclear pore complex protein Nup62